MFCCFSVSLSVVKLSDSEELYVELHLNHSATRLFLWKINTSIFEEPIRLFNSSCSCSERISRIINKKFLLFLKLLHFFFLNQMKMVAGNDIPQIKSFILNYTCILILILYFHTKKHLYKCVCALQKEKEHIILEISSEQQ